MRLSKNGNPPKALGFNKAMDLMRQPGTRLVNQAGSYYVGPRGGYVEPDTAHKIIKYPQVVGSKDGMWPGMDQTWRLQAATEVVR